MSIIDDILGKYDLSYQELSNAEKETLRQWTQVLESNQLTVGSVRGYINSMKISIQNDLSTMKQETPTSWLTFITLFIPFYGLIKKWYQDQNRIYLEARLRNLMLIEAFLSSPKQARAAIDRAVAGMASGIK